MAKRSRSFAALLVWLWIGAASGGCGRPQLDSVILIVVDTLRADHLGLYGSERPTSPFLDRLAREGRVFERAFATSPWTLPSFGSMLTGLTPTGHAAGMLLRRGRGADWSAAQLGPRGRVKLHASSRTLAEMLTERGMTTLAVVQNPQLDPAFGIDRGFAVYDYTRANLDIRRADSVVDRSLALVDEHAGEAFLLLVHLLEPQLPYSPPESTRGRFTFGIETGLGLPIRGVEELRRNHAGFSNKDKQFVSAAYDEEIAAVDAQLERLVAGLRERGVWQRSLVLLTSDHGEELFEHNGFEHGHSVFNEVLHVPLIAWGPGVASGREETPVSIADVTPTALEAVGANLPEGLYGRSLWPLLRGDEPEVDARTILAEGTLWGREAKMALRWPHKLISSGGDQPPRLFDLDEDPGERDDIAPAHAEIAAALQRELRTISAQQALRRSPLDTVRHDPDLAEGLRELGYIE